MLQANITREDVEDAVCVLTLEQKLDPAMNQSRASFVHQHPSKPANLKACYVSVIPDAVTVFCPGFQKGRVPSEKGTLAR